MTDDGDPKKRDEGVSRAEERDRLIQEALAHSLAQEAQYAEAAPLEVERWAAWKLPVILVLFAIAGYLAVIPPVWAFGEPKPVLAAPEVERGVRAVLFIQAQQIEVHRMRMGRLPASLDEVAVRFPGLRYVRSNNRVFQLVAPGPDGANIVYDSARPDPRFAPLARLLGDPEAGS